jgi:hypothetical protein
MISDSWATDPLADGTQEAHAALGQSVGPAFVPETPTFALYLTYVLGQRYRSGHTPQPYRNQVPQHHHRDSAFRRVGCDPSLLSGQHRCGCMQFGTKCGLSATTRLSGYWATTSPETPRFTTRITRGDPTEFGRVGFGKVSRAVGTTAGGPLGKTGPNRSRNGSDATASD